MERDRGGFIAHCGESWILICQFYQPLAAQLGPSHLSVAVLIAMPSAERRSVVVHVDGGQRAGDTQRYGGSLCLGVAEAMSDSDGCLGESRTKLHESAPRRRTTGR